MTAKSRASDVGVAGTHLDRAEVQAVASRTMVAQDARWLSNALFSSREQDGVWPITLFGHASRVVFEGSKIAHDQQLGVPALVRLLTARHEEAIKRARQATKLLDDKLLSLDDLKIEMASTYASHHSRFTGNAVWFARRFETDLAVATLNNGIIAASIPLHRRFGLESLDGPSVFALAESLGGALTVLAALTGDALVPEHTVDYRHIGRATWHDRLAQRYLEPSYESVMTLDTKLLLLLIESEVATSAEVLPHTAGGFETSVFRAQTVVLFHALSAIRTIVNDEPWLTLRSAPIRQFLESEEAAYFLEDPAFRMLRNYAMHYGIRDPALELDPSRPMFGLVESLISKPMREVADQVAHSTSTLAALLREWRS